MQPLLPDQNGDVYIPLDGEMVLNPVTTSLLFWRVYQTGPASNHTSMYETPNLHAVEGKWYSDNDWLQLTEVEAHSGHSPKNHPTNIAERKHSFWRGICPEGFAELQCVTQFTVPMGPSATGVQCF